MNMIPKLLRAFNRKFNHTSFYGNKPINSGVFGGKDGEYIEVDFDVPTKINMITMFENGENVTDFEIYAEINNEIKMIYKQNRVADFRVCAIDEIVTSRLRIVVVKTRKNHFNALEVFVYDLPRVKRKFRKMAYVIVNDTNVIDENSLAEYNCFNLISEWKLDEITGRVCSNSDSNDDEAFARLVETVAVINKNVENPEIVVTLLCEKAKWMELIKNPNTIPNVVEFVKRHNLSGVSFDWEYPTGPVQWRVFDKFIVEMKKALGDKILTLALASWIRHNFSKQAVDSIDFVEVMTYDNMQRDIDGHHSEFFIDGPNAIHNLISRGFRPEQLDLGIPFYARPIDGATFWKDYKDEVDKMDQFTNVVCDEFQGVDLDKKAITVKPRFYNSRQMVVDKTAYAIYAKIGGVMAFHLTADTKYENPLSLTSGIAETVRKRTK